MVDVYVSWVGVCEFFELLQQAMNDVWNEKSLSNSQRRKTELLAVCIDRDTKYLAPGKFIPPRRHSKIIKHKHHNAQISSELKFSYNFQWTIAEAKFSR